MSLDQTVYLIGLLIATIIVQGVAQWRKVDGLSKTQTQNVANIEQSKTDIASLRTDLDREREQHRLTERERDDLRREVLALKDRLEILIATNSKQGDQLLVLQLENATLKGRLQEQGDMYPRQIKDLQLQVNDLSSALMTSKSREGDLSTQLLTTQAELISARSEVDLLKSQVSALEAKVKQLQAEKLARVLTGATKPAPSTKQPTAKPAPKPVAAKKPRSKKVPVPA